MLSDFGDHRGRLTEVMTMRLRKGSKVEVIGNTEGPRVEWRCAHIISGNEHTYSVQYDRFSITSEACVERVPRKAIRPCPPLVKGSESWVANDVVEVYSVGSWKAAIVLKLIAGDFYLVRLLGSCEELKVHKVNMRVRQSWQDDQWVVMRKGSCNSIVGKSCRNLISNSNKVRSKVQQDRNNFLSGLDGSGLQEPHVALSTTLKRVSPFGSSLIEAYPRKMRAVMNKGESERSLAASTAPLLEKVDAIAYPQNNMGENCMLASFNNGTNRHYEIGKGNPTNVTTRFLERIAEPDYSCRDTCSVGSCSVVSSNTKKYFSDRTGGPCQDEDALSSDSESLDVGDVDKRCLISPKEVVAERIHRLELHAYCSTLEAMFASGPLSWEQEELLSNLRCSLHISNDEHLMEIRNLVSAGQPFKCLHK